jgi:hypothetical protein
MKLATYCNVWCHVVILAACGSSWQYMQAVRERAAIGEQGSVPMIDFGTQHLGTVYQPEPKVWCVSFVRVMFDGPCGGR